jgi:hypothetical protein
MPLLRSLAEFHDRVSINMALLTELGLASFHPDAYGLGQPYELAI